MEADFFGFGTAPTSETGSEFQLQAGICWGEGLGFEPILGRTGGEDSSGVLPISSSGGMGVGWKKGCPNAVHHLRCSSSERRAFVGGYFIGKGKDLKSLGWCKNLANPLDEGV